MSLTPANGLLEIQFECIQKLDGHHGEVWALAVSHQGNFVATAAHDKSIRIWEKLDEPVRAIVSCHLPVCVSENVMR